MSETTERDRIVSALDALRSPQFPDERHVDHSNGGSFRSCPVCRADSGKIADALVSAGYVLRRASEGCKP